MLEWLQNPFVAIALAVGAMFFGYFFGLFEGRGQGYKRRQDEEADKKSEPEAPTPLAPPTPGPVLPPDESPLLEVSREETGNLRLRLEGQRLDADTLNAEQRKRLIAVLTQIRPWLEAPVPRPQPAPPAPARPAPAPVNKPAPPPVVEEEGNAAPPSSIVAQIDSILHTQLAGTPLMEKGIRLQESPEGGVIVWVGIQKYQAIEDVPDEHIKAAIRSAIKTWENKYTPGI